MSRRLRSFLALLLSTAITMVVISASPSSAQELPNPVLSLTRIEPFQQGEKQLLKYHFEVSNRDAYPAEMFAPSPQLPPCGKNAKAARTWVDVYAQNGKRLGGFCAFASPAALEDIWFAIEEDVIPPSWVYIELTDRKTNKKYKSNLAETSS